VKERRESGKGGGFGRSRRPRQFLGQMSAAGTTQITAARPTTPTRFLVPTATEYLSILSCGCTLRFWELGTRFGHAEQLESDAVLHSSALPSSSSIEQGNILHRHSSSCGCDPRSASGFSHPKGELGPRGEVEVLIGSSIQNSIPLRFFCSSYSAPLPWNVSECLLSKLQSLYLPLEGGGWWVDR
jgi:hypothetical protein